MKGIVLAGGKGTRLRPVTKVLNKNLLPVYDKPMIIYGVNLLANCGIDEIAIVAEPHYHRDYWKILRRGSNYGVRIEYINDNYDKKGPAQAVYHAKDFAGGNPCAVLFADCIFDETFRSDVENFVSGAVEFVRKVENPKRYGVVEMDSAGNVISIEEKPDKPKSNWICSGFGLYDNSLFSKIKEIKPGPKGEYYMTDVVKLYLKQGKLRARKISGFATDAGTFDSLLEASNYWAKKSNKRLSE